MNLQKMTQKSIDALRASQDLAVSYGNQELKCEHLFYALLHQENGLIPSLLERMEKNAKAIMAETEAIISRFPKVSGVASDRLFLSTELDKALKAAEAEAEKMRDSYVSVEHLALGLLALRRLNLLCPRTSAIRIFT